MGKGAEETTRKKKKGRPSLLDIQKRILKQQRLQETAAAAPNSGDPDASSNPSHRSGSRRPASDGIYQSSEWVSGADEEDDEEERARKKQKPLSRLDSKGEKVLRGTDTGGCGSVDVPGPTTPLPNKMLLAFILDRVQKKDTHGVFSEPVDPEELPDYHDIIKHPMDFGTVRKKLEGGAYANLEEFEKDVLLICSNAMQYNSPDTIFFRQARSMQEIAKKDFENLRQESDDSEPDQTKILRRGRPPGSGLKKLQEKSSADRTDPEASSKPVLANGDNSCSPNAYNLRKGPDSYHLQHADSIGNASSRVNRESQSGWFAEFDREFPASVLRSVMKEGKKLCPADENKRDSYKQQTTGKGHSVLCAFESEKKYLTVVDLQLQDHGYARSIARFASNLGPVVWKIASKKIKSILPKGTKFGPGWVGEDEILGRSRFPFPQRQNMPAPCDRLLGVSSSVGLNSCVDNSESARILASQSRLTSPSNSTADVKSMTGASINRFGGEEIVMQNMSSPFPVSSEASLPPEAPGMVSSGYRTIQGTFVNHIDSTNSAAQRFNSFRTHAPFSEELPWNLQAQTMELNPDHAQIPPDWNVRFSVQGSSSSSLLISSQQPNLGLQL